MPRSPARGKSQIHAGGGALRRLALGAMAFARYGAASLWAPALAAAVLTARHLRRPLGRSRGASAA
jgi:hypothetical protein